MDFITWALYSNLDSNSCYQVSPHLTSLTGEMMDNETNCMIINVNRILVPKASHQYCKAMTLNETLLEDLLYLLKKHSLERSFSLTELLFPLLRLSTYPEGIL